MAKVSAPDEQPQNSKTTIIAFAVLASLIGSLLHEGLGHGVTAWLRGDIVTELSSNHLNSVWPAPIFRIWIILSSPQP